MIRTDIQALRGLAVTLVIFFHAGFGWPYSGYLGVDIFFVISGYLITGIIVRELSNGTFSLKTFYLRRAKRLLPAALTTFLLVAAVAPYILTSRQLEDLQLQLIGAVTFTANFVLMGQTGYFEGAAETKPLLHVWSLAVEEQFYLIIPALLLVTNARFRLPLLCIVMALSLLLCFGAFFDAIGRFYLLPSRAWELAIGSLVALLPISQSTGVRTICSSLYWFALLTLVTIPLFEFSGEPPGLPALCVCLATAFILMCQHPDAERNLIVKAFAKIGDFSYSLYLVHWPIFSLFHLAWVGEKPIWLNLTLVVLSYALGLALYHCVERPVRYLPNLSNVNFVSSVCMLSALVVVFGFMFDSSKQAAKWQANKGFGPACEFKDQFQPSDSCQNSRKPKVLVWGDSFAMHLVPALLESAGGRTLVQATKSVCGPTLGLSPYETEPKWGYGEKWARDCFSFNQSVAKYLEETQSIELVVLSSPLRQYIDQKGFGVLTGNDGEFVAEERNAENLLRSLQRTATLIRKLGKRVVFVAPPPNAGHNVRDCIDRKDQGKINLGPNRNCKIYIDEYRDKNIGVNRFLSRLSQTNSLPIFSFDRDLCDAEECKIHLNGKTLYLDGHHFSPEGSKEIGKSLDLMERLYSAAK